METWTASLNGSKMTEIRDKQRRLIAVTQENSSEFSSHTDRMEEPTYGGGDGGGSNMVSRITLLEYRAEAADQRMARMEDKLDRVLETVSKMPTINGLWGMIATVLGICIASVGTVIAILTWLQGFHK